MNCFGRSTREVGNLEIRLEHKRIIRRLWLCPRDEIGTVWVFPRGFKLSTAVYREGRSGATRNFPAFLLTGEHREERLFNGLMSEHFPSHLSTTHSHRTSFTLFSLRPTGGVPNLRAQSPPSITGQTEPRRTGAARGT